MLTVLPIGSALDPVPTFRLVDSGATGSELNLGLDSAGNIFVGGWNAVARSTDDGATWTLHGTMPAITFAADRVLVVDKDTGRVFVDDTTLGCTILSWSDDQAQTWTTNPLACGGGATDHQKIAVGRPVTLPATPLYPNLVYVCANGLSHTDCGVSNDGGLTFLTTAPHGVGCAFQGAPISDAAGNLFEPTSQCGLKVRRNIQNGLAQWQEFTVTTASSTDAPDLTATPDGTLYLVHTGLDWKPQLWRSTSHGLSWTGPYAIPVPGLVSAAFPVVVAGANGRIAISFYGSTTDALGWDHNPGTAPATTRWEGYVAVVTDAASAAPTLAPVKVTAGDPLQIGCISKLGGCLNNIADYMDVDVGPDGRVYAVYTDGCVGCATSATSTLQKGIVAIQMGGPTLL